MKIGCNYEYWQNSFDFTPAQYIEMTDRLADIGFDVLEISADHLYCMNDVEIAALKEEGERRGISFSTNSGPAKRYDLSSADRDIRNAGIKFFRKVFENMEKLGSPVLVGAIYSYWPTDFTNDPCDKDAAWERSIECLRILGDSAGRHHVKCALEVLNRNESFILNDSNEALEYVDRIGSPNINILLDTYHMNIEEDNMYDAIRNVGGKNLLGHVHVGECNRKLPGMNNSINWEEIGRALRDVNYEGYVVMEPFLLSGGEVGKSCRVWRDLSGNASEDKLTELITSSLAFLRDCLEV